MFNVQPKQKTKIKKTVRRNTLEHNCNDALGNLWFPLITCTVQLCGDNIYICTDRWIRPRAMVASHMVLYGNTLDTRHSTHNILNTQHSTHEVRYFIFSLYRFGIRLAELERDLFYANHTKCRTKFAPKNNIQQTATKKIYIRMNDWRSLAISSTSFFFCACCCSCCLELI